MLSLNKRVIILLMIGEVYIMKKSKILFILLVAIFSTVFSLRVNAATSFPNQITTSIVAWDPVVVNLGGGYTIIPILCIY